MTPAEAPAGFFLSADADEFCARFGVWPEARPFLHLLVEEADADIILRLQRAGLESLTASDAARVFGLSESQASQRLASLYNRGLLLRHIEDGAARYSPADFYHRLAFVVKHEAGWDAIPPGDRQRIDARYLDEFMARVQAQFDAAQQEARPDRLPNDAVLLLSEVLAMIDAARDIVVLPCDCRRLGQNCERPVETCLRFDQAAQDELEQGHGRRLTRDEASDLVRRADRQGLMHTGSADWQTRGLHDVCNCCACDCYPFRAAARLGTHGVWPLNRYIAARDASACNLCGTCVKRCHFQAFYLDRTSLPAGGRERPGVSFRPEACWGCGLCANTCPAGAIRMQRLEPRAFLGQDAL